MEIELVLADAGYCSEDNLTTPGPDRLIATGKDREVRAANLSEQASGQPPPEATAVAIDVPPIRKYCPLTTQDEHIPTIALLGASVETMCAPGALKFGLA